MLYSVSSYAMFGSFILKTFFFLSPIHLNKDKWVGLESELSYILIKDFSLKPRHQNHITLCYLIFNKIFHKDRKKANESTIRESADTNVLNYWLNVWHLRTLALAETLTFFEMAENFFYYSLKYCIMTSVHFFPRHKTIFSSQDNVTYTHFPC